MLQIFYDSQDFFLCSSVGDVNGKEHEKSGPKKGVISQSVKDVIQSLVDDDLVFKDKIGTSVYFWSLPNCAANQLRTLYRKLETDLQTNQKRHTELVEQCNALKKGHEESVSTPKKAIEVAHSAANRWTGLAVFCIIQSLPLTVMLVTIDSDGDGGGCDVKLVDANMIVMMVTVDSGGGGCGCDVKFVDVKIDCSNDSGCSGAKMKTLVTMVMVTAEECVQVDDV
ncbi:Meiotic nuclear division protein 1 -like protein [Capsicum chinense]|nr:Meiotic nuclear division protein 1 -like protein [Capsicum chinense]